MSSRRSSSCNRAVGAIVGVGALGVRGVGEAVGGVAVRVGGE